MNLIEQIEKAEGPDRILDWEIHCRNGMNGVGAFGAHPIYTGSVDVAMSLIPDGSSLESLGQFMCLGKDGRPLWQARIRHRTLENAFDKGKRGDSLTNTGFLAGPAIAVCVAALRATAALKKNDERRRAVAN